MTDPMPTIMQAAERLRRVKAGEDPVAVYEIPEPFGLGPWGTPNRADGAFFKSCEDAQLVADFALSIWPKGERPVAIEERRVFIGMQPEADAMGTRPATPDDPEEAVEIRENFGTAEIARLAMHWRMLDRIIEIARAR